MSQRPRPDAIWDIDGGALVDVSPAPRAAPAKPPARELTPEERRAIAAAAAARAREVVKGMIAQALAAGTHGTTLTVWCAKGRHLCPAIFYEPVGGGGGVAGRMTYCEACWLTTFSDAALRARADRAMQWRRLSAAELAELVRRGLS